MKRISLHIMALLQRYEAVALPGFGLFSINYISAHREGAFLLPPAVELSFTPSSRIEDSLLLHSYMRKENCAREEAAFMLESDIDEIRSALALHGEATLQGLGMLTMEDGVMEFIPHCALSLPLPVLKVAEEIPAPEEDFGIKTEAGNGEMEKEEKTWVRNPDYYYIPVHKKVAKFAASFLLVVIVAIAALMPVQAPNNPKAAASILPISVTTADSDTVKAVMKEAKANSIVATTADADTTAVAPKANIASVADTASVEEKYYAIVAAFKSTREVDRFMAEHTKDKGSFEVLKNGSFNLIAVSSDSDREKLDSRLPLIRVSYPDAWVLKK